MARLEQPMVPRAVRRALAWVGVALAGLGSERAPLHAQAAAHPPAAAALFTEPPFAPPPTEVEYERYYRWVEECAAAVKRVKAAAEGAEEQTRVKEPTWQEVLARRDPHRAAPAAVLTTARRCPARWPVHAATGADLDLLQEIYYAAPDSVLAAVLARRLALLLANASPQVRADTLLAALTFGLQDARPARVAWAEQLLDSIARLGPEVRQQLRSGYGRFLDFYKDLGDTTKTDRYMDMVLQRFDSADAELPLFKVIVVLPYLRWRAMVRGEAVEPWVVDSARRSAIVERKTLDPADSAKAVAAAVAPAIRADFWFRRADSTAPRPTRGKLGLVVFLEPHGLGSRDGTVLLRELHERFGDALEITLVTHTHGYAHRPDLGTDTLLEPAAEARHLARYFFEELELPGALAVEVTPFSRLPAPDRRRVEQAPPSATSYGVSQQSGGVPAFGLDKHRYLSYAFQKGFSSKTGGAILLVDRDGTILERERDLVGSLVSMIAGLLSRTAPKS